MDSADGNLALTAQAQGTFPGICGYFDRDAGKGIFVMEPRCPARGQIIARAIANRCHNHPVSVFAQASLLGEK
jgi:hypothetical protein